MTDIKAVLEMLQAKGLTPRESVVAAEIAKAVSTKDAASTLFITEKTVKYHLTKIYKKLGFKSAQRSQLIRMCAGHLVHDEIRNQMLDQQTQLNQERAARRLLEAPTLDSQTLPSGQK